MRQTWREKRLARGLKGTDSEDSQDSYDLKEDNAVESGDEGRTNIEALNVNMVFVISAQFQAPEASDVAKLTVGAERAVFEKPTKPDGHMKLLYMKGHIDGTLMGCMISRKPI
jgi:hypothetical protein